MMLAERLLAEPGEFSSSYNFGPGDDDAWPVERIATKLVSLWGEGASWVCDSAPGVHEAHFLRLDASKAHAELGWRPLLKIADAIEWTTAWYQAWRRGADMRQETQAQIADYEKELAEAV
jgi:CDP-glucose 4,6-dehydratase